MSRHRPTSKRPRPSTNRDCWPHSSVASASLNRPLTSTTASPPRCAAWTLPRDVADEMGDLYILWNNRICPFETFARQFTAKLSGKTSYRGLTADQVACGWIFYYDAWKNEPMIKVKNGNVKRILGINGKYASLEDFYRTVSSGAMQWGSGCTLSGKLFFILLFSCSPSACLSEPFGPTCRGDPTGAGILKRCGPLSPSSSMPYPCTASLYPCSASHNSFTATVSSHS